MRGFCAVLAFVAFLGSPGAAQLRLAPPGERPDTVALELALRRLSNTATFMQTDAHPDDEDNGLLAMLGLGHGIRATLVTLTRGDGGQNEIGPELGQSLGVLRTEELLAVHRFDGAEQYFTRAIDFGFSFSTEETIEKWGRDEILPPPASDLPPKGGSYVASGAASQGSSVASAFRRKTLNVTVGNNLKAAASANVSLQLPAGWTSEPATQPIRFAREDESATVTFTLVPPVPLPPGDASVKAVVRTETGAFSDSGYQIVEYPHIHRRHVVREAAARVKVMDVTVAPGLRVGYVMGVGDKVRDAIEQLGVPVTLIDAGTLASGDLSPFTTIVLGVRAYERRPDLRANNQRLLQYVENGGTVLVQYQRAEFNDAQYGPYPARTAADRITDENAPVEILAAEHPVFTTPNRIGPESWQGWVQERGTYFMGQRDPRYVDLLRAQDPFPYNAGPKTGILVEARVGKGRWLYTGLGLWRQLPAGTDGAYRLLANLISLGKS